MGVAQRHEHVVPSGVRRLGDVGRRRIGVGVGVGVEHTDDLDAPGLGVAVGPEMVAGVDGVELGRGGEIAGRVAPGHVARGRVAAEQPARLVGQAPQAVAHDLGVDSGGQPEHPHRGYRWPPARPARTRTARDARGTVRRVAAAKGPGRRAARRVPDDGTDRIKTVARNRRARHEYDILETYECGLALQGSEVKSLRAGRVTLADAYARVEGGEAWLLGVHIPPYEHAAGFGAHDPERRRKLLLHRDQIDELMGQTQQKALTLVPLSIYFKDGRAKVELALARGPAPLRQAPRHRHPRRRARRGPRGPQRGGQERGPRRPQGIRLSHGRARPRLVGHRPGGRMAGDHNTGGDRFRLWSSIREKRAVVSGATLKSRNKKQTPSLSSRWLLKK